MPVQLPKPWWVHAVEFIFDVECTYYTKHEVRFRKNGSRERAHDCLSQNI